MNPQPSDVVLILLASLFITIPLAAKFIALGRRRATKGEEDAERHEGESS